MNFWNDLSYSQGRKAGWGERDAMAKDVEKQLRKELKQEKIDLFIEKKSRRKLAKTQRQRIIDIENMSLLGQSLLAKTKGLELWIKTTIEKKIQEESGMLSRFEGKIYELETDNQNLIKGLRKIDERI